MEKLKMWVVWRLPKWVIYWATVRCITSASSKMPDRELPTITGAEAIKLWV